MSLLLTGRKTVATSPILAATIYAGIFVLLLFMVVSTIADVIGQYGDLAASTLMLEQLDGRRPRAGRAGADGGTRRAARSA